jgi:hypothetical protein
LLCMAAYVGAAIACYVALRRKAEPVPALGYKSRFRADTDKFVAVPTLRSHGQQQR